MTQNAIIISVAPYVVIDEKTNAKNEGCTVRYLLTEDLTHFEDKSQANQPFKGFKPSKSTVPLNDYDKFPTVPALYELKFSSRTASDGKVSLTLSEYKFLSAISINKVVAPKI